MHVMCVHTCSLSTTSPAFYIQIALYHPCVASSKLKPDMVLEDMESDNECQQKCEESKVAAASTSLIQPSQEVTQQTLSNSLQCQYGSDTKPKPELSESVTKMSQEDAGTQTGRWTPFIESIKREAEDVALATMEER